MNIPESGSERLGPSKGRRQVARAFDVRMVIAALFGIYGVIVTIMGLVATSPEEIEQAAGVNINLWSGIGMLVFAALFGLWVRLRPLVVPDESQGESSSR
ncbi:hypothetical protein DFQ14_103181 [Halopolyspora algeriensis]|uniref:Uncharacterized protein n=1 Tax=Halopolyspora algeriensis TaxID=1500506 RepID=A0A368VTY3_9ACTN|nr:hypothetical protein [Halopolyspora algeriensis]RCW45215.1 hypothetical protein DFQ14_103181 [Halopolyspora algeriensis]TQM53066.1 hypothetical protein FHU43_2442 [Halopolyspora algeriensis]